MGIGAKIKEARLKKGLTQEQLANMIGVKQTAIGNYENNVSHPRTEILYKLFDALDVDANYLFEGQYTPKETHNKNTTRNTYYTKDKKEVDLGEAQLVYAYRKLSQEGQTSVRNFTDYTLSQEQKTATTNDSSMPGHLSAAEDESVFLVAAHNDAELTEEELKLMQQDIDDL